MSGWQTYANAGGNSNVVAYHLGVESIAVRFGDGSVYTYTHDSAGKENVGTMKMLARQGHGLNSFINRRVRKLYAGKS